MLIEPITRDGEAQAAPTIGWPLGAGHDIGIIPMLLACQMQLVSGAVLDRAAWPRRTFISR